jgi:hypothetical protein
MFHWHGQCENIFSVVTIMMVLHVEQECGKELTWIQIFCSEIRNIKFSLLTPVHCHKFLYIQRVIYRRAEYLYTCVHTLMFSVLRSIAK